jgi:hypothetical protein
MFEHHSQSMRVQHSQIVDSNYLCKRLLAPPDRAAYILNIDKLKLFAQCHDIAEQRSQQ